MIDSVILCGGHGTRLYPETRSVPKALVHVGGRPILDWVLGHLVRHGSPRVVLCTGFRARDVRAHVRRLSVTTPVDIGGDLRCHVDGPDGVTAELIVCDTGVDTPTGARLHHVEKHLRGDALVTYSDVLADVAISDLVCTHRAAGAAATLTTTSVRSPFGHVAVSDDGRVTAFHEKPWLAAPINIGFLVLTPQARELVSDTSGQLEVDLLPELAADNRLAAFVHTGQFHPMDTLADQRRLDMLWRDGDLDWLPRPVTG